ncbi:MAG: glycosyltransferase [Bacteroidetes bacterium]|nr:glycosyltransferase [Bacteroidota bacterium]
MPSIAIEIILTVGAVAAVFSSLLFMLAYRGWMKALRQPPARDDGRAVSVVIAAHDEARNIGALLEALCAQDAAKQDFEVVVVDDRSTDQTGAIARAFAGRLDLRVQRVEATPPDVSPKKHALHLGISEARHDTILLTDADCVPGPFWIKGMRESFSSGADAVVGLAPLDAAAPLDAGASRGLAASYAAFESRRTTMLAVAAAASGLPYMASGRSWGFTRAVYTRSGGLPPLYAQLGGDDDLLLQRLVAAGCRVGTCTRKDAMVRSATPADWRALFVQKMRHYRVSSAYRGRAALLLGAFVAAELLVPLLAVVLTVLIEGPARVLPLLFWLWKLWYDTNFLAHAVKWMDGNSRRLPLALSEGLHIFFSALTGFTSFVKPPHWK